MGSITHKKVSQIINNDIFREFSIYIPVENYVTAFSLYIRAVGAHQKQAIMPVLFIYHTYKATPDQSPPPIVKCKTVLYMKTLDRKAAEIFRALLALQTTKIDNSDGTYMSVYIELIGRIDNYNFFSLAHYGQQNGDAMRDPEMLFALHKETQQFIPYYYRNDYCGIEQNSVKWSEDGIFLNRRLQAEHTTFANQWLRNIAAQQGIL